MLDTKEYLGTYVPKYRLRTMHDINASRLHNLLQQAREDFISHPDSLTSYIALISSMASPAVFQQIDKLFQEPFFKIELAGHARTVARGWIANRNLTLLTHTGLRKTVELCTKIGKVNEMSAYPFLQAFSDINSMDNVTKDAWVEALKTMQNNFDPMEQQSIYNNISRILDTATANGAGNQS
uniref:tRNA modification GTPase MnmE n=1 Tax=Lygus hesperus TaxID=30085 RepID=A0A0A9YVZ1_LYGHE